MKQANNRAVHANLPYYETKIDNQTKPDNQTKNRQSGGKIGEIPKNK